MALPIAWPFVAVPLLPLLYRRLRLLTRRQPLRSGPLGMRLLLLGVVLAGLAISPLADDSPLLKLLGSALLPGLALGLWGVRLTRIELTTEGDFYTPNRWIGLALMAVLLTRLLYRYVVSLETPKAAVHGATMASGWLDNYRHHPATLALFGLLLGYYFSYNAGLLVVHRRHVAAMRPSR